MANVFIHPFTCTYLTVVLPYSKIKLSLFTPLRHGKSRDMLALIFNIGTCWRRVVDFTPWLPYRWLKTLVPIRYDVGLAPKLVWIIWRRENSFDPARS